MVYQSVLMDFSSYNRTCKGANK